MYTYDYTMEDRSRFFIHSALFLATQNDCTIFAKGLHHVYLNIKGGKSIFWNKIHFVFETKSALNRINQKGTENPTDHFQQQSTQAKKIVKTFNICLMLNWKGAFLELQHSPQSLSNLLAQAQTEGRTTWHEAGRLCLSSFKTHVSCSTESSTQKCIPVCWSYRQKLAMLWWTYLKI